MLTCSINPNAELLCTIDEDGYETSKETLTHETGDDAQADGQGDYETGTNAGPDAVGDHEAEPRKFYVDGGHIEIVAHLVYELDAEGNQLRVVQYTDYAGEKVRTLFTSADELQDRWADPLQREEVILVLQERGIAFKELAAATGRSDADPLDLLCHLAFETPLRTRKERTNHLRKNQPDFFDEYGPEAREILGALLDKYTDHGPSEFSIPDALQVAPINAHGNVMEIAGLFGGALRMKQAVDRLQSLLYSAQIPGRRPDGQARDLPNAAHPELEISDNFPILG